MTITWDLNPFLSFIWNFRFSTILDVLNFLSIEFRSKNKIENRWKNLFDENFSGFSDQIGLPGMISID